MKIFFAPDTRAVRVVWLFEELGLPYELELFKLGDASMRSSAYLGIHPLGRVPTLVDEKVTIFESGAIVQYVLAKYGGGRLTPDVGSQEFPVYLQWFHFAEGMIMPPINIIVVETVLLSAERRNQVNVDSCWVRPVWPPLRSVRTFRAGPTCRLTLIVSASGRRSKRRVQRESRGAQTSPRKPNRFVAAAKRRSLRR